MKSKSKFIIQGTIENKSCLNTRADPKTVIEPYPTLKIAHQDPKKVKNDPIGAPKSQNLPPKLSHIQKLELKES